MTLNIFAICFCLQPTFSICSLFSRWKQSLGLS